MDTATELLLQLAQEEAVKLQKAEGKYEKGIISTQVRGLIMALGKILEKLEERGKNLPRL